jgi:hypothetical protein
MEVSKLKDSIYTNRTDSNLINRNNFDKVIKFRTLNRDHNFVFIKVKNSIQIYDPINLNLLYSFYMNEIIKNFDVSPNDSTLVVNTKTKIEVYDLVCKNLSDYDLKIKYSLRKSKGIENIENLSISSLGDAIVVIDIHRIIKVLNKELEIIKNMKLEISFYPQTLNLFPLEFFNVTYDTKNILICKYNYEKVALIYKNSKVVGINSDMSEHYSEYSEKVINFKDKILFVKEMQKEFTNYLNYAESSIFFFLLENLNFLILRKTFENESGDIIPDLIVIFHLDISTQTEYFNFPYLTFSLLYDNENPIFRTSQDKLNLKKKISSGFLNPETWSEYRNKNTLDTHLNLSTFHHKNISVDYLIFNFFESLTIYKIEGLHSHPYNNLNIQNVTSVKTDENYLNSFYLLKMTKTLDKMYCIYFFDQNKLIRKFQFEETSHFENAAVFDTERACKLFSSIKHCEFNEKDRKTFFLEYTEESDENFENADIRSQNRSEVTILNSKLEISKILIFKNQLITNVNWIQNSDFLIFVIDKNKIGIVHFFSKHLNKKINEIDLSCLQDKLILIDPEKEGLSSKIDQNAMGGLSFSPEISFQEILHLKQDSIFNSNSYFNKPASHNDIKFELLIISQENSVLSEISIQSETNTEREFNYNFKIKTSEKNSTINDPSIIKIGEIMFKTNKLYFCEHQRKSNIFSVKEIDCDTSSSRVVFQALLLDELLYTKSFYNNYIIFITKSYINSFDILTGTFYRVRNDIIQSKNIPSSSLDLFKFGIFIYFVFITNECIKLIRIPRNKNLNEIVNFSFKYEFEISQNFTKILMRNDTIILNESQIARFSDIITNNHNLHFDCDKNTLVLINSNPSSIYDMETFSDFILSGNDDIVKIILNMFCESFSNIENFLHIYKSSKTVPNFYKLENFENLKKIIFDNNSSIEEKSEHSGNDLNSFNDFGYLNKNSETESDVYNFYNLNSTQTAENIKPNENPCRNLKKLRFKSELDDSSQNPIFIISNYNKNFQHLKNVYDVISNEGTRNVDNFTKYLILKMMYKNTEFDSDTYKLSTADLCWISLINDQEYLIKFLSKSKNFKTINWKFMKTFSIPLWIKNDLKLKELMETVGKNEYKFLRENESMSKNSDSIQKNYVEYVALYFLLANKMNTVLELYDREFHNENIKKFVMRDFSVEKNRKLARKNAQDLIDKKKYIFAAFFFLLGDDIHSALDMTLIKMKDINLTIAIIRLFQSPFGNETWKKVYSIEKLYQEYFIEYGIAIRDPWLVTYGYLGQGKIDLALEYLLSYNNEYHFDGDRKLIENLECNDDYIEIIRKIYAINVFDYKLLIFAKNLEKIYALKLEESKANVKSVQNTNFEDIWDFDDFGGSSSSNNLENQSPSDSNHELSLKEISINFDKLANYSLVNALKRGSLYSPILTIYKTINRGRLNMNEYCRDLIKILVCDRIILDLHFIKDSKNVELYFIEMNNFFKYLEENKLVNTRDINLELNKVFLWMDNFKNTAIPSLKSHKELETLVHALNFAEKLISRNLPILIDFNFHENINLNKIEESFLSNIIEINDLILKISSTNEDEEYHNEDETQLRFQKTEQNLYIFRIYFIFMIYLAFLAKILLSYNKITQIYKCLNELVEDFKNIETLHTKVQKYHEYIKILSIKLMKIIQKEKEGSIVIYRDTYTSFLIQIFNISFTIKIKQFLYDHTEIEKNILWKFKSISSHDRLCTSDHYIQDQFKFIYSLFIMTNNFIDNFENNFNKYINNYLNVTTLYEIHEELKLIYMKNLSQESNYYKYSLFQIKSLFDSPEKLKCFEEIFEIKKNMLRYMSNICRFVKYERKKSIEGNDEEYLQGVPYDFLRYSGESVKIVNSLFKNGYEIANFSEGNKINRFAINNCDLSKVAVALVNNGHKKINLMNNFLIKKRSEGKTFFNYF